MGIVFDYREHAPPKGEMPDSLLTTSWLAGWCKCLCTSVTEGTFDEIFHFSRGAREAGMTGRFKYEYTSLWFIPTRKTIKETRTKASVDIQ